MGWIEVVIFFAIVGCAWYLGYHMRAKSTHPNYPNPMSRDYFVGLNFLLNEETDKAVDIFIKMLEVDSNTVETHLAVGKLFRKRGEVERAIRIHQNLIARPQLDKDYREQALFALGEDYLSAGMLDRAERIFLDLVNTPLHTQALKALLDIYQQEKQWDQAIQTAKKIEGNSKKSMQATIAHYWCELAEVAFQKRQVSEAFEHLEQALKVDKNCARASLLQAKIEMTKTDYKSALRSLKRIKNQNPDYLSEAIEPIAECYEKLNDNNKLVEYLKQILEEHPRIPVVLILAERLRRWKGDKVAANFVADYVRRYPSLDGIDLFINLYISNTEGRAKDDLTILQNLMKKLLADKPSYQCISCGFSGKTLHWSCPGCKRWNAVQPLHSIEG